METQLNWKSKTNYVDIDTGEIIPGIDIINYTQLTTKKETYVQNGHGTVINTVECKRIYAKDLFQTMDK